LLTLPIQSANAVASERINERLGAILTTPLTAREILDEWLAPVRRWTQFLVRPLVVIFAVEALVKLTMHTSDWTDTALYLGLSLLTVWIYPGLALWLCLWIGLRIRNQVRALMTSLLIVVAWCVVPLFVSSYLVETGLLREVWNEPLRFVSPTAVIGVTEAIGRRTSGAPVTNDLIILAFIQLGLAALLMWIFRRICLRNADRYLGRV